MPMTTRKISVAPMPGCENKNLNIQARRPSLRQGKDQYSPLFAFRQFASEVTIAGFKYVTNHESFVPKRILWCSFVLFGFALAVYQISMQIRYYMTYPTNIDIKVINNETLVFPTVTICNENFINRSKVEMFDPKVVRALEILYPPIMDARHPINFTEAFRLVQHHVNKDWAPIWESFFNDMAALMPRCIFNSQPCDSNMYTMVTTELGHCLQFNHDGSLAVSHAGSSAGLQLTLNVDAANYLTPISPSAGYRVYLHDAKEPPMMYERSFKINVNQHTLVQVSTMKTIQKPSPYGTCSDQEGYISNNCIQTCAIDFLYDTCGCVIPFMKNGGTIKNKTVCTPVDMFSTFLSNFIGFYVNQIRFCECPNQCSQTMYPYAITSSDTSPHFIQWYMENNQETAEYIQSNLVLLDIYYSTLEYEVMETKPSYSLLSLFCDIGGALGLILGSTVLTLFEIADFICVLLWDGLTAKKMNRDHL